jgi:hypothetical protein
MTLRSLAPEASASANSATSASLYHNSLRRIGRTVNGPRADGAQRKLILHYPPLDCTPGGAYANRAAPDRINLALRIRTANRI